MKPSIERSGGRMLEKLLLPDILELIREGDTQEYAHMIRSRHGEAVTVIERLAGQSATDSAARSTRGGRRRANG